VNAVSAVTSHVLDTTRGGPAVGVGVRLERMTAVGPAEMARARTDDDGRVRELGPAELAPGSYRLVFDTDGYFAGRAFFPEVTVTFRVDGQAGHYHVPLLLSPHAYTTYRGS
jgi:5-hydroxyisourate hydrolase